MSIDRSRRWWVGSEAADLNEFLQHFTLGPQAAVRVVHAACPACGGSSFRVRIDDDAGCAERTCVECGAVHLLLDSADTVEDADLGDAQCPCGAEVFDLAVGFALGSDEEVHWVYVALRCTTDGVLGTYADWKIDYTRSRHLLELV